MACFLTHCDDSEVSIPETEELDNVTFYVIRVRVGTVSWTVSHRYSDFHDLNSELVSDDGVPRDIFPPKKIMNTKRPAFVEGRRKALEAYIEAVFDYLRRALPQRLALFLDFHLYDIHFLLRDVAERCFRDGEAMVANGVSFDPLELYAVSERLKQPCPEASDGDKRRDFGHILDVCSRTHVLIIAGRPERRGRSDIPIDELPIDLSPFKAVEELRVVSYSVANLVGLGTTRDTLVKLTVVDAGAKNIAAILLCDSVHKVPNSSSLQAWPKLTTVDFSGNLISEIDESIVLLPEVRTLKLSQNRIRAVDGLSVLHGLSTLDVSANRISQCDDLHTKLGNVAHLDVSENYISTLVGFTKLYSLESLDASRNRISDIDEVDHVGRLPCLENLRLTGNLVSTIVDYRVKVFERFGSRAPDLCLDNETPTPEELDSVCVRRAIRIVKEGKTPTFDGSADSPLFLSGSTDDGRT